MPNKAGEKVVLMKVIQASQLRVVDPYEDPHIWAVVDDGCNSSCHTKLWRKNADMKLAKLNFQCHLESSEMTTFKGVGEKKTTGKWRIPFGIQLIKSKLDIQGSLCSHEMDAGDHVLLLSQSIQAKFGMIKNARSGSICLQDYEHQELEVVRMAKTGLFMIRIDHLSTERLFDKDGKPHVEKDIKMIRNQPASSSADASATANVAHDDDERESSPSPEVHVGAVADVAREVYDGPPDEGCCTTKATPRELRSPHIQETRKAKLIFTEADRKSVV